VIEEDLEEQARSEPDTDFLQKVKDATTTAQVKTRLIGNGNIAAGDIDVDTRNSVVRLSGKVGSDTERQLAEFIARNTSGVRSVSNELEIGRSGRASYSMTLHILLVPHNSPPRSCAAVFSAVARVRSDGGKANG
jgi:hypothetical protein